MTARNHDPDGGRSDETGIREQPADASAGEPLLRVFENPVPDWDRYTIVDFLGEGAMGLVYRAVDLINPGQGAQDYRVRRELRQGTRSQAEAMTHFRPQASLPYPLRKAGHVDHVQVSNVEAIAALDNACGKGINEFRPRQPALWRHKPEPSWTVVSQNAQEA